MLFRNDCLFIYSRKPREIISICVKKQCITKPLVFVHHEKKKQFNSSPKKMKQYFLYKLDADISRKFCTKAPVSDGYRYYCYSQIPFMVRGKEGIMKLCLCIDITCTQMSKTETHGQVVNVNVRMYSRTHAYSLLRTTHSIPK